MEKCKIKGIINSFQSMGAVDGPGIRHVVFMQGCPLRCVYCHNPETWSMEGEEYLLEDVIKRILRYKSFIQKSGGVTVSGGEPLLQGAFVAELFRRLKEEGIHTALDTSGIGDRKSAAEILKYTDLVLCDLKFLNDEDYRRYCGARLNDVLEFLTLTETMKVPLWIRHVVVPGMTDGDGQMAKLSFVAKRFTNLEKLELLPFRKICLSKYENMGIPFTLQDIEECSEPLIRRLRSDVEEKLHNGHLWFLS